MLLYFVGSQRPAAARVARPIYLDPATKAHEGTPRYGNFGSLPSLPPLPHAPALPPRPKAATIGAPGPTEAEIRATFARDDPRYAGGNPFDLDTEQMGF